MTELNISNFIVINQISSSSFNELFTVKDKNTGGVFAAKISLNSLNYAKTLNKKLPNDIKNINCLNHPAILKYIGYSPINFYNEPKPVIISELMPNKSLEDILYNDIKLRNSSNLNDTKKLINIYGISSAMSYLHSHNIIHGYLYPKNILMDHHMFPKIADFQPYNFHDSNQNAIDTKTSIYLAPELCGNSKHSKEGDVYAFGMIIYEILSNEKPFKNLNFFEILTKVASGNRPEINNSISSSFSKLIQKCWSQNTNDRPTFDEITKTLRNDSSFITDSIDRREYANYVEYIDEYQSIYEKSHKSIFYEDFIANKTKSLTNQSFLGEKQNLKMQNQAPNVDKKQNEIKILRKLLEQNNIIDSNDEKDVSKLNNEKIESEEEKFQNKKIITNENNDIFDLLKPNEKPEQVNESKNKYLIDLTILNDADDMKPVNPYKSKTNKSFSSAQMINLNDENEQIQKVEQSSANKPVNSQKETNIIDFFDLKSENNQIKSNKLQINKELDELFEYSNHDQNNISPIKADQNIIIDLLETTNSSTDITKPNIEFDFYADSSQNKQTNNFKNKNEIESLHLVKPMDANKPVYLFDMPNQNNQDKLFDSKNKNTQFDIFKSEKLKIHKETNDSHKSPRNNEKTDSKDEVTNPFRQALFEPPNPAQSPCLYQPQNQAHSPCLYEPPCSSIPDYLIGSNNSIESPKVNSNSIDMFEFDNQNQTQQSGSEMESNQNQIARDEMTESETFCNENYSDNLFKCNSLHSFEQISLIDLICEEQKSGDSFEGDEMLSKFIQLYQGDKIQKLEAMCYLQESIQKGNPKAMNEYGKLLYKGDGVDLNRQEAARYFKMSSDKCDPDGMYNYACVLFNGDGVKADKKQAVNYFKKLAIDRCHLAAMNSYGKLLYNGNEVPMDKEKAAYYFKTAAQLGFTESKHCYANCLYFGNGVPENKLESFHYFKMSADEGYVNSYIVCGCFLLNGNIIKANKTEGAKYIKMAVDNGIATAMLIYSFLLSKGEGVKKNRLESFKYLKKAADNDNVKAMTIYAHCLYSGKDLKINKEEAARYYKMAADKGGEVEKYRYAQILYKGLLIPVNKEEASFYYKMAAEKGNVQSMYAYATMLRIGDGIQIDKKEAAIYYKMAAEKGNIESMYFYGMMSVDGDIECNKTEATNYLMEAADAGFPQACYYFGLALLNGHGIPVNQEFAVKYLKKAASKGVREAREMLDSLNVENCIIC